MIRNLQEGPNTVEVQETTFSLDVFGRYICNTYDEAINNGGFPFDAIVIGAGMYGSYVAEKIYRQGKGNLRVLLLEAGNFLVSEHVQNLSRIGLNAAGPITSDPGIPRERVWGLPWRSNVGFPGLAYCLGGRSLYWGGWSPKLTDPDLKNWPAELRTYLKANYNDTEKEIGVDQLQTSSVAISLIHSRARWRKRRRPFQLSTGFNSRPLRYRVHRQHPESFRSISTAVRQFSRTQFVKPPVTPTTSAVYFWFLTHMWSSSIPAVVRSTPSSSTTTASD